MTKFFATIRAIVLAIVNLPATIEEMNADAKELRVKLETADTEIDDVRDDVRTVEKDLEDYVKEEDVTRLIEEAEDEREFNKAVADAIEEELPAALEAELRDQLPDAVSEALDKKFGDDFEELPAAVEKNERALDGWMTRVTGIDEEVGRIKVYTVETSDQLDGLRRTVLALTEQVATLRANATPVPADEMLVPAGDGRAIAKLIEDSLADMPEYWKDAELKAWLRQLVERATVTLAAGGKSSMVREAGDATAVPVVAVDYNSMRSDRPASLDTE